MKIFSQHALFHFTAISISLALLGLFCDQAWAELTGDQTARMTFGTMPNAVYGWGNENNSGNGTGGCLNNHCYLQNGIVAGVVKDPLDDNAHFHKAGTSGPTVAAQYHPDSTGIYIRMADLSRFSLQSLDLDMSKTQSGGNLVIYGYTNAINPAILSNGGTLETGAANDKKYVPTDPEGGNVPYIASYVIPNDNTFNGTVILAQLVEQDPNWGDISAFWITMQDFNHSPTTSYPSLSYDAQTEVVVNPYPAFDIRLDNVVLGARICPPNLQIIID